MKCDNATKFHRKSGVAKWRDLLFSSSINYPPLETPPSPLSSRAKPRDLRFRGLLLEMFFYRAYQIRRDPRYHPIEISVTPI